MRLNFDGTAGSLKSILEDGKVVKRWWLGKGGVTETNLRQRVMLLCADRFHTGLKIIWNHLRPPLLPPIMFCLENLGYHCQYLSNYTPTPPLT